LFPTGNNRLRRSSPVPAADNRFNIQIQDLFPRGSTPPIVSHWQQPVATFISSSSNADRQRTLLSESLLSAPRKLARRCYSQAAAGSHSAIRLDQIEPIAHSLHSAAY
jgi:hypothetical protein